MRRAVPAPSPAVARVALIALAALAAVPASAHEGHAHAGLLAGLAHPVGGLDHLVATLGLGLCAGLVAAFARVGRNAGAWAAVLALAVWVPHVALHATHGAGAGFLAGLALASAVLFAAGGAAGVALRRRRPAVAPIARWGAAAGWVGSLAWLAAAGLR
jgi:urease accessory protein